MNRTLVAVVALSLVLALAAAPGSAAESAPPTVAEVHEAVTPHLSEPARSLPRAPRGAGDAMQALLPPDLGASTQPGTEPSVGVQRTMPAHGPNVSGTFFGIANTGVRPPDPTGEANGTYFVQSVNGTSGAVVAVYDKGSGDKVSGPWEMDSLWDPADPCVTGAWGDPIVQYDQLAHQWILAQGGGINGPPYYQCVAVSVTDDPLGSYFAYSFSLGNRFGDYPKLSVWADSYVVTTRDFLDMTTFDGPSIWVLDRFAMQAGNAASSQRFDLPDSYKEVLAADVEGNAWPWYWNTPIVGIDDVSDQLLLWDAMVDWGEPANSSLSGPVTYAIDPFTASFCLDDRSCIGQPGATPLLDSLARHLMYRFTYRNFNGTEMMAVTHTVDADATKTKFRWYVLGRNTGEVDWNLTDQGTFGPDATNRWTPSVAIDANGNLGIVYNISDTTSTYPGVAVTGRLFTDPPGSLALGETVAQPGAAAQTGAGGFGRRWGDYNHISMDPDDPCTFWFTAEFVDGTGAWRTVIGHFAYPSCPTYDPTDTTIKVGGQVGKQGSVLLFTPKSTMKVRATVPQGAPGQPTEVYWEKWVPASKTWAGYFGLVGNLDQTSTMVVSRKINQLAKRGTFRVAATYVGDQDSAASSSKGVVFKIVPP